VKKGYTCRILVRKPEEETLVEIPRCRWQDNIKIDIREGLSGMDWINLAKNRDQWEGSFLKFRRF
jgi:hypothetical protein